ncbi:uncharacterized protein SPSK_02199 [Sporothrix schenckii 1099-18]|uniref:Bromo domain-containing protein n=1 Tax=Sporothrix schenckii 1099-18 TaxID=1397361 RepID=A0A0F2MCK8_SPOSC|nr:uncharacterized protein SPSK_02199 [Sporothrix schenckii 1099-18]KJR86814.1 hypothetical protein SPSK_02199 [Sporothrix schenckii 1099-18]
MTTTTGPSPSMFTPLESLLLFQSILKHGVEPDAFARIATVLQSNPFIRSDDRYNADRLTAESLRQLFLHLLRSEFGEAAGESGGGNAANVKIEPKEAKDAKDTTPSDGKKRKIDTPPLPAAHAEQLPILVERLYVRYREHIVNAIREDERRIEKVQGEIKLLEQQAAGGGGRGSHARAAEAKAAAAAAAAAQNGRQQQQQQQQTQYVSASPTLGKNAGLAGAANGGNAPPSVSSSRSDSVSAQPSASARHTPERHLTSLGQRGAALNVPLLPATSRPANQPPTTATGALVSVSTPPSITSVPAVQHAQQLQHARTTPQLTPIAPASAPAQRPSRTLSVAATQSTQSTQSPPDSKPLPAAPAGQPAAPPQPASRSISPAQLPHPPPLVQQQLLQQQQTGLPQNANAIQLPPKGVTGPVPSRATPPSHTPGTQTPIPNSPSTTHSAASQTAQPLAPVQADQQLPLAAGPQAGTPRPLVPATQKQTPIAPTPQFQRIPGGPPMTPGPQGAAGGPGLVPRPPFPEHVRGGPPSRTPTPVQSPRPAFPHTPIQGVGTGVLGPLFLPRGSGTRWKPSDPTPSTPGPDVGDMASPAYEPLSPVQPSATSRSSRSGARAESADLDMVDDDAEDDDASPVSPSAAGSSAAALRQPRNLRKPQYPASRSGQTPDRSMRGPGRPSRHSRSQGERGTVDDESHPIKAEASTPRASFDDVHDLDDDDGHSRAALKRKRGGGGDDESVDISFLNTASNKPDPSVVARRRLVGAPTPPTHVLWMRGFPKISASALDQISSHRHANMFAHKIRDRDAPGYGSIVRHPVDLKSIRMAISQGNKAANTAIAALPESERESINSSNSSSVWLPIHADLVPPRGIINSSQLESELVHMFANAVMYNPDSHRGPGPAFLVGDTADDDDDDLVNSTGGTGGDNARYKVDEDGVVNDTRDMYVEVEKLLSEMRSAERQRGMPAPPPGAKGLDLPLDDIDVVGVVGSGGAEGADEDEDRPNKNDSDKNDKNDKNDEGPGAADADEGSGTAKRRRITRGL